MLHATHSHLMHSNYSLNFVLVCHRSKRGRLLVQWAPESNLSFDYGKDTKLSPYCYLMSLIKCAGMLS